VPDHDRAGTGVETGVRVYTGGAGDAMTRDAEAAGGAVIVVRVPAAPGRAPGQVLAGAAGVLDGAPGAAWGTAERGGTDARPD